MPNLWRDLMWTGTPILKIKMLNNILDDLIYNGCFSRRFVFLTTTGIGLPGKESSVASQCKFRIKLQQYKLQFFLLLKTVRWTDCAYSCAPKVHIVMSNGKTPLFSCSNQWDLYWQDWIRDKNTLCFVLTNLAGKITKLLWQARFWPRKWKFSPRLIN